MKVTFICCVFNEILIAPKELSQVIKKLEISSLDFEILIIDNCSFDGTSDWLRKIRNPKIIPIFNRTNLGKGGSIKKGITQSSGDICVIFYLDGEYSLDDALKGIDLMRNSNLTLLLASRTLSGEKKYIYYLNYMGVRFLTWIINFLYRSQLTDTATGLKLFRTDFYKNLDLWFNGFNVDFEIVCLALNRNASVKEFEGSYNPRSKSEGKKINAFKDGLSSIIAICISYLRGWL